jgi:hypothetical protein
LIGLVFFWARTYDRTAAGWVTPGAVATAGYHAELRMYTLLTLSLAAYVFVLRTRRVAAGEPNGVGGRCLGNARPVHPQPGDLPIVVDASFCAAIGQAWPNLVAQVAMICPALAAIVPGQVQKIQAF